MKLLALSLFPLGLLAQSSTSTYEQSVLTLVSQTNTTSIDYNALVHKYQDWPRANTPFMTCSVSTLVINNVVPYKYPVSCVLSAQPQSAVTVFIEACGLKFSTCYLQFDDTNWSTPQLFDVRPLKSLFSVDASTNPIYMLAYTATESYNNQLFTLPVSITSRDSASCSITPNGQVTTIGNTTTPISLTGKQGYSLVESSAGLRILARISTDSTLVGVVVQYYQAEYLISYKLNTTSPPPLVYMNAGNSTDGTNLSLSADGSTMTVSLSDNSVITVGLLSGSVGSGATAVTVYAISLDIKLSPIHYQMVGGVCGFWDDSLDASKLVCNAQSWARTDANMAAYATCWNDDILKQTPLVGTDTALMTTPTLCQIPSLSGATATAGSITLSSTDPSAAADGSTTGSVDSSSTNPSITSNNFVSGMSTPGLAAGASSFASPVIAKAKANTPPPCQITHNIADNLCRMTITVSASCTISAETYIEECIAGVMSSCLLDLGSGYQSAYDSECQSPVGSSPHVAPVSNIFAASIGASQQVNAASLYSSMYGSQVYPPGYASQVYPSVYAATTKTMSSSARATSIPTKASTVTKTPPVLLAVTPKFNATLQSSGQAVVQSLMFLAAGLAVVIC